MTSREAAGPSCECGAPSSGRGRPGTRGHLSEPSTALPLPERTPPKPGGPGTQGSAQVITAFMGRNKSQHVWHLQKTLEKAGSGADGSAGSVCSAWGTEEAGPLRAALAATPRWAAPSPPPARGPRPLRGCRGWVPGTAPWGSAPAHPPGGSLDSVGAEQRKAVGSKAPGQAGTSCARGQQASWKQEAVRKVLEGQTVGITKGRSEEGSQVLRRPRASREVGKGEERVRKERIWVHRHGKWEGAHEGRTREPAGGTLHSCWTSWLQQRPRSPGRPPSSAPPPSPHAGPTLAATRFLVVAQVPQGSVLATGPHALSAEARETTVCYVRKVLPAQLTASS